MWTPDAELFEFCQSNRRVVQVGANVAIFPGEEHGLNAADTERPDALEVIPPSPAIRLFVCVTYHSIVNDDAVYHTGFVAYLVFEKGLPAGGTLAIDSGAVHVNDDRRMYDMS